MSDGYVKNGRYVKTSGMARTIPHGTLAEIEAMIANGTLKEGDACAITDDYEEIIGSTDISKIADGTLTGAVDELNSELARKGKLLNIVHTTGKGTVTISYDLSEYDFVYAVGYNSAIQKWVGGIMMPIALFAMHPQVIDYYNLFIGIIEYDATAKTLKLESNTDGYSLYVYAVI